MVSIYSLVLKLGDGSNDMHIVDTPGVTSLPEIRLTPYLKTRSHTASAHSAGNDGIAQTELLLHSADHQKLDFVGREANDDGDSQLKHYVAVVDPVNKTWEFVEARRLTLRGAVKRRAKEEDEEESSEDEEMVCLFFLFIYSVQGEMC